MTGDFWQGRDKKSCQVVHSSCRRSQSRDTSYTARDCVVPKKNGTTCPDFLRLGTTCVRLVQTCPDMFTTLGPTFTDLVGRARFSKCLENLARLGLLGHEMARLLRRWHELARLWTRCDTMRVVHTSCTGRDTKSRMCKPTSQWVVQKIGGDV